MFNLSLKQQQRVIIVAFLAIPLCLLITFSYFPAVELFFLSTSEWDGFLDNGEFLVGLPNQATFVGLDNYRDLLEDTEELKPLLVSLYYFVGAVIQLAVSLWFAVLVNSKLIGRNLFKTFLFLPFVLNAVAASMVFQIFYQIDGGFDCFLSLIGCDPLFTEVVDGVEVVKYPQWLADPSIVNLDSWQDLANPRDISKIFSTPEYAAWRSFRESDDSRYVALTLPRVLSRVPYGANTNPVEGFNFEETTDSGDSTKYNWMNAAYAMGVNINRSFADYGWCARIRGVEAGGIVESLPTHTFPTDDGGVAMKCPTEIAITDRREAELSKNGFLPLVHWKNTDYAVFLGGQTVNKPKEYDNPDATANASLSARLPYIFATSRFAHYLKCIVRDKVGSFKERADMERWLSDWISNYVTSDPSASEEVKAKYPLAEAKVTVEDVEGQPGYYTAKFYLRPHYQLEGLTTSLRLTTKVPTGAK